MDSTISELKAELCKMRKLAEQLKAQLEYAKQKTHEKKYGFCHLCGRELKSYGCCCDDMY